MLFKFRLLLIVLVTIIANYQTTKADVTLVSKGKARAAIYVAPRVMAPDAAIAIDVPWAVRSKETPAQRATRENEARRRRLRESVNDLARCLQQMAGTVIPIHQRLPQKNERSVPILIGEYATARFGEPGRKAPFAQGWRMSVVKNGIGLQGENDESTSYAIYELLDRLGCRWFVPGELGEVIPHSPIIRLKEGDWSTVPTTLARNIWYSDDAFNRRNRLTAIRVESNHALESYITEQQRQEHPEWRAVIGGKPHKSRLKWSNPEVARAIADEIIARLDKNYMPSVSLSPDDGASFDETDDTRLDAGDWDASMNTVSITDRYIVVCNRIAERVTKKYPGVQFGFLAYVQYTRPPAREKLHPNLVPVIAPITYCRAHAMTDDCPSRRQLRSVVEGWSKMSHQLAYYNYMFHLAEVSAPYPMIHQMSEELPILYKNNVVFWQPETTPGFEQVLPGMWLSLRLAWNSQQKPQEILRDFYTRYYGAAAKPMQQYWEAFDNAWTQVPEHAGSLFGYARRFTPEFMQQTRLLIDEAGRVAQTADEARRVAMQERAFRQFERFMQMRFDLNSGNLARLDQQATEWLGTQMGLGNEYAPNQAFSKVAWTPQTVAGLYFKSFAEAGYTDAARMARTYAKPLPPLHQWKYEFIARTSENPQDLTSGVQSGEAKGWQLPHFNDAHWQTTDIGTQTWATLNVAEQFGTMWYRTRLTAPKIGAGKKVYLWLSGTDSAAKLFVNGTHVPFTDAKGETVEAPSGFAQPFTFDVTSALKPGETNQITIAATRTFFNELGTGGLLGPVYLFHEK